MKKDKKDELSLVEISSKKRQSEYYRFLQLV